MIHFEKTRDPTRGDLRYYIIDSATGDAIDEGDYFEGDTWFSNKSFICFVYAGTEIDEEDVAWAVWNPVSMMFMREYQEGVS